LLPSQLQQPFHRCQAEEYLENKALTKTQLKKKLQLTWFEIGENHAENRLEVEGVSCT
jgi:hypothetical protein